MKIHSLLILNVDDRIFDNLMSDHLHPGPEGYKVMTEAIQPVLDEMMAGNPPSQASAQ